MPLPVKSALKYTICVFKKPGEGKKLTSITIGDLCFPQRWRFITSEKLLLHISSLYTALGTCLAGGYGSHQSKRKQRLLTPEITGAIVEMTKLRAGLGGT